MIKINKDLIEEHGINEEEYQFILESLNREPSITELGIFSAMWSEHCSYKSSKTWLRKLPTKNSKVIQGPGENAGVIDLETRFETLLEGTEVRKRRSTSDPGFMMPRPYPPLATRARLLNSSPSFSKESRRVLKR